ncbi:endonuclease [Chitinophaga sp. SYP-B3965]|uniref:YraN family protein n=1 Tax=Chitinophaga sp. SYP-B3965 TaxID=2663120 RepID=UPI0012997A82|nr:YraN family protein [Chitinophaga sp. SYP-B3965]MRG44461.1 endonuclease [Chitinophaga sp. SYP-B3965]
MASHHEVGKKGELLAADHLRLKNYQVLHTNWTYGNLELDIVARYRGVLIFVEVKTRSTQYFGMPEEFVHANKAQLIRRAADKYMDQYGLLPEEIRFDIIAITVDKEIVHFEDAF